MDISAVLENVYHENMMQELKGEEELQWENMRHNKAIKSLSENENEKE